MEGGIIVLSIAIDATASCTPLPTGIGRYTEALAEASLNKGISLSLVTRYSHFHLRKHRLHVESANQFWIQEPIWPLCKNPDVIHVTDARVPRWPLASRRLPKVATLHDVFHILPGLDSGHRFSTPEFQRKKIDRYRKMARDCDMIIAVSEATRSDFLKYVECDPAKVSVVHHGVDPIFSASPEEVDDSCKILQEAGIPEGGILYVGDISSRKNLDGIIDGFLKADLGPEIPLVIAGESTFGSKELEQKILDHSPGQIVKVGWRGHDILPALYRSSKALLFCTHYEGFGLPVLEALASETPVVISRRGATSEIAGDHGDQCDPEDAETIASALHSALARSPQALRMAADHAGSFTWGRCAEKTLEVYQHAMEVA